MVEFAFVFPLLFMLLYGVVVYAYIFVLQASINFAAQEAAASTVAVNPTVPGFETQMSQRARNTAVSVLSWLPSSQASRVLGSNGDKVQVTPCTAGSANCPPDSDGVTVKLVFDVMQPTSLFPVISLGGFMGMTAIPPLPAQLTAKATVRI